MAESVEVARYMNEVDARTAAAMLSSIGIESLVLTDNAGGAFPSMSALSGGVRLVVHPDDEQEALDALAEEYETEQPPPD
jgi:3'-phosphoadenosine 5'-phosphosulfate sulfotransferase (PAPS reductase)/FAD synthetase